MSNSRKRRKRQLAWKNSNIPPAKRRSLRVKAASLPVSKPKPPTVKLLIAQNEYFSSKALWRKISNIWSCVQAQPFLSWMVGMNPNDACLELIKRNCSWHWLSSADFDKADFVAQSKSSSPSGAPRDEAKQTCEKITDTALAGGEEANPSLSGKGGLEAIPTPLTGGAVRDILYRTQRRAFGPLVPTAVQALKASELAAV